MTVLRRFWAWLTEPWSLICESCGTRWWPSETERSEHVCYGDGRHYERTESGKPLRSERLT